jgi:aminopeptidase N
LIPTSYDLTIQPLFKADQKPEKFNGKVKVNFNCEANTDKLVLHMVDLVLNNSTLKIESSSDKDFKPKSNFPWTYDPITHFLTFKFDTSFKKGFNYTFSVSYVGLTNDVMRGFYRGNYKDNDGNQRWLVTSQMEYIGARRAFVSFDEPGFKAVFRTTIIHDKSLTTTLSNNKVKLDNQPISSE